jgi:serine/arginine repetitive matrix protein 1
MAENEENTAHTKDGRSPLATKDIRRKAREQSVSKSSDDENQRSPRRNSKEVESDGNAEPLGPTSAYDKKAAKKRHREEKKLRKKEKRRKREERHRRKEEKRASKHSCDEIAFVALPPDSGKQARTEASDSASKVLAVEDEEQQRIIEDELRRKALDSLRAKKVIN